MNDLPDNRWSAIAALAYSVGAAVSGFGGSRKAKKTLDLHEARIVALEARLTYLEVGERRSVKPDGPET